MHINSGQLHINKTEVKDIRILLDHAKQDLDYRAEGSYCKVNGKFDEQDAKKALRACDNIEWILDHANFKKQ